MCKITLCVGFDYHDDSIRVCVMDEDGNPLVNRSVPNDVGGVIDLVSQYGSFAVCAVEACCGAADVAHRLRTTTGWDVRLAHPGEEPESPGSSPARPPPSLFSVARESGGQRHRGQESRNGDRFPNEDPARSPGHLRGKGKSEMGHGPDAG